MVIVSKLGVIPVVSMLLISQRDCVQKCHKCSKKDHWQQFLIPNFAMR